jgi:hypothetical protein
MDLVEQRSPPRHAEFFALPCWLGVLWELENTPALKGCAVLPEALLYVAGKIDAAFDPLGPILSGD